MQDHSRHSLANLSPLTLTWPTHSTRTAVKCSPMKNSDFSEKHYAASHIYIGNTLDTSNFKLEDVQKKLNHLNMNKSTGPYYYYYY